MRHDVAPVARRVADRQQHRPVLGARPGERLLAPRVPVHRVVGVLAQVEAGLAREAVHPASIDGRFRRAPATVGGDGRSHSSTGRRGPGAQRADRWRQVALLGVSAAAFDDERGPSAWPPRCWRSTAPRGGRAADRRGRRRPLGAVVDGARRRPGRWRRPRRGARRGAVGVAREAPTGARSHAGSTTSTPSSRRSPAIWPARPASRCSATGPGRSGGRSSGGARRRSSWSTRPGTRFDSCASRHPRARRWATRAQWSFAEVIEAVRRGDSGPGRSVPADGPGSLEPGPMLDALREDPATRDRRLLRLATEVRRGARAPG